MADLPCGAPFFCPAALFVAEGSFAAAAHHHLGGRLANAAACSSFATDVRMRAPRHRDHPFRRIVITRSAAS